MCVISLCFMLLQHRILLFHMMIIRLRWNSGRDRSSLKTGIRDTKKNVSNFTRIGSPSTTCRIHRRPCSVKHLGICHEVDNFLNTESWVVSTFNYISIIYIDMLIRNFFIILCGSVTITLNVIRFQKIGRDNIKNDSSLKKKTIGKVYTKGLLCIRYYKIKIQSSA